MAYIQPRRNKDGAITSYTIKVHKGRDPVTGKQLTPYTMSWKPSPGMTEKQIETELKRQEVLFEEQCKKGVPTSNIKLADFCAQYLDIVKDSMSPLTIQFYQSQIDKSIIPALGHMKLKDIKTAHIQSYIQQLYDTPRKKQNGVDSDETLSPSTVRRYLTVLQSILKQAVKLDLISDTPAKFEKLTLKKTVKPKIVIFTKQEAAAMLACLEQEDLQFQTLVQLSIHIGSRRGEVTALKFSDVDFENRTITLERAAYKTTGETTQLKETKDYEIRTVTVSPACLHLIAMLKEEKKREAERLGDLWHEGDWLFTQFDGTLMNPQTPSKQFRKFLERHGLPHKTLKSLRHTSATLLLYGGANIKQVQGRLGHGDIETTNKYLKYIEEIDIESSDILDKLLNPKPKEVEQSDPGEPITE